MNNGDVLCYLKKYPNADRLEIVCVVLDQCLFNIELQ
jgi:hypothetical protein